MIILPDDEGSFNTGLVKYFDQLIHPTINLDKDTTDELISKCVLLTEDWEEIEKQASATMRNAKLLRILIARPFDTVKIFLDALIESDHKNIYSGKLVSDMKKYIHEEYSTYPKYFGDDNGNFNVYFMFPVLTSYTYVYIYSSNHNLYH